MREALIVAAAALLAGCGRHREAPPQAGALPEATSAAVDDRDAYAKAHGLMLRTFDLNRDKEADVFKFYKMSPDPDAQGGSVEQLVRKDIDLNHDGKVDIIRLYDAAKGQVLEERTDLDFDGRYDELAFFEDGLVVRKEIDLDYDGKPEIIRYYDAGKLARVETDRNGDGRVDSWEYYEDGRLDRIGTDNDGDGAVDKWERLPGGSRTPETVPAKPE